MFYAGSKTRVRGFDCLYSLRRVPVKGTARNYNYGLQERQLERLVETVENLEKIDDVSRIGRLLRDQ
jgi:hypothetical protein